jgi:formate dehydrogenase iron-sulfur subunit
VATIERLFFIDTSKCIACKACQVACKQWHQLPAEETQFTGSYQNPPEFSGNTLTYIRFIEFPDYYGKLQWLFFKNQCRHCIRPKCGVRNTKGVKRLRTGIVLYTEACTLANVRLTATERTTLAGLGGLADPAGQAYVIELFKDSCPFRVPRYNENLGRFVKCDFCYDRFNGGYGATYRDGQPTTACEMTCPPGAIKTGPVASITAMARARRDEVRLTHPDACLHTGGFGRTNVLFLLTERPESYGVEVDAYGTARGV